MSVILYIYIYKFLRLVNVYLTSTVFPLLSQCVTREMERQGPGEKQPDANRTGATTPPITSAAVTMATVSSGSTTCTGAPSTSLSIISPDRQAVQVIQHAIHRPQSMAAQYLHQMYAAQQQHLMLQTAALQQHQHSPHLQSLATIQQASVCQRQTPSSSSGGLVHQPAGVSQNSITIPASPVTAQLIGRTQTSTGGATTISQQAMLLGNRPANCNQAQMYLRTQMLILTPASTVATVQSDLPAVTSCSSLPTSSQVQNLALRAHLPGALATAHGVILKPSAQSQAPTPTTSLSKTSICGLKTNQLTDTSTETGPADVTRLASGPQIMTPAYSTVQTNTLVKQQLACPPGQRVAHHQFILQQAAGGCPHHRHLQPIALRVAPQETNSNPLPLSVKRLTTPGTQSKTNSDPHAPSSSSVTSVFASLAQTSIPAATVQPQPPPLVAAPQRRTTFPQVQNQPPPPPPPLVLPRLPQNPPASLQRLSLHSVQALAVQSGRMLLTERELPVAEALVQMPYQNLPPPQTVAVNLKVHRVRHNETPLSGQTGCKVNGLSSEERKDARPPSPQQDRTLTPLTGPPKQNGAVSGSSSITSSRSVIRPPVVEEPSQLTTTTTSSNPPPPPPPPPSPPLPPPVLPAAARGPSQPRSSPASVPGSPDRILTTHVLTHLIEGFVIREGLEPFPVVSASVLADQQASLPESQEMQTNGDAAAEDSPLDADQSDSTDSEMEDDGPAADELGESLAAVLQCEFCGSRGYAHTFLRSKRFCSMTCVRRFSVSCSKRITVLRAGRCGHRPMGRRGRPPSRVNGASREHFLRQARGSFGSEETRQSSPREDDEQDEEEEDEPPVPMTTRLRRHAEREREREQEREREPRMTETISVSEGEDDAGCPAQWNVQQVFSFINSLPGGQDVAEEFRSQEIDGQALLLLTEDHLVSTMNLKLGPALKLCAHINSLKDA
ncbi:polyhomeotic-like protein 3 isoform X2 [Anarrhichthys ocellatus]|uniref:polyhomeotic-like protein 3 isoform X2 n=1 Tax=Anarrhichthys ocellatus TaxID=433405 RepID=UPI0012EDA248|nr:polyhomeotic-like protein 3 isoform X2 [Anarrhichthys ocellatus]